MMQIRYIFIFLFLACVLPACAIQQRYDSPVATTTSTSISDLHGYTNYPKNVQTFISEALALSKLKLNYQFGSANPENGGLDCSGAIYYLLRTHHQNDVPRQADQIYRWVKNRGNFHAVKSRQYNSKEFRDLKPGDLLFWTGTYPVKRKSQITHVMLYLGKNPQGKRLIFGASSRRVSRGGQKWNVNVFDFTLPQLKSKSRFIGYGCIPNLNCVTRDKIKHTKFQIAHVKRKRRLTRAVS